MKLSVWSLSVVLMLVSMSVASAQVRSSASYQIQSDSLNVGGGLSTSTSFTQESTIGEVATGESDSATYSLRAGYQQMQEIYLAIAGGEDVAMSPSIPGVTGGTANGSTTVTVVTDNPAGYELSISVEGDPGMQSGVYSIADYPNPATPSYDFDVTTGEAFFGFTPEGNDIVDRFKNNGSNVCNTGTADDPDACWSGLDTSDPGTVIAQGADANHPAGATTSIKFRVEVGSLVNQPPGEYVATTTVTVLPL